MAPTPSTLNLAGGGSASFTAEGMTVSGGTLQSGQSIDVPAGSSMSLGADLTSGGIITMEDDNNVSYLYLNGHTLTNTGTLTVNTAASSDYAYLYNSGALINAGTVQINGNLYVGGGGVALTNHGSVAVASTGSFSGNSTFTNSAGGSVSVATGGSFTDGTFVQAGGSNSGVPVAPSTLVLGGAGSAAFTAQGMTIQGGPLQAGQSIDIPAGGSMSLGADLTSGGTISMEDNNNVSYLYLNGHTLTNTGTLTVNTAAGGDYAYLYNSGTFTNAGSVQVAGELYLGGATFTNGVGGSVSCSPAGRSPASTYVQAGGSNWGAGVAVDPGLGRRRIGVLRAPRA